MSDQPQPVAIIRDMGGLVFDAVLTEEHVGSSEVTEHPVATGVSIADHMYDLPDKLTLTAIVSDVAPRKQDGKPIDGDQYLSNGSSRSREAFRLIHELRRIHEPFAVQTGLTLYENMVITEIRTSQDKDSARVLRFTASLHEVKIVSTQTAKYIVKPKAKTKTKRQAEPEKKDAKKEAEQVENAADARKKKASALWRLFLGEATP